MNEAVQNRRHRKRRFIILKIISQSPLILLETWKFLSYKYTEIRYTTSRNKQINLYRFNV